MMQRRSGLTISAGIVMVLVALAWIIFAPTQAGGRSRYVIVSGNSMEPRFHRGDLVLVRESDTYRIGDVVTYRHPDIGPVIHRIIARDGARYVFQGDNNDWIDRYQPVAGELLGKEWIRVPRVGTFLAWIRDPRNVAITAGVIGVIIMSSFMRDERRVRETQRARPNASGSGNPRAALLVEVLKFLVVVAVAALAVSAIAFSRPLRTDLKTDIGYTQSGRFSYSTEPSNADGIYDAGVATAGEPLFRNVSDSMDIAFHYQVSADVPATYAGSWRLVAELGDVNGWKRTIELVPEQTFTGASFDTSATLAFSDIQALLDTVEAKTGLERSQYTLAIVPSVQLAGTIAGEHVEDSFTPRLELYFDALQIRMVDPASAAAALAPTQSDTVVETTRTANTLSVLAWRFDVGATRSWAVGTLVAALVSSCLVALGLASLRRTERKRRAADAATQAIEVRAWADLLALSKQLGSPVQSDIRGRYRRYFIEGDNLTWQFFEIEPHGGLSQ